MIHVWRSYSSRRPNTVLVLGITLFRADSGVRDSAQPKRQLVKAAKSVETEKTHR